MDRKVLLRSAAVAGLCLLGLGALAWQVIDAREPTLHLQELTLKRGGCYGACPIYEVTVSGDGRVDYRGHRFVRVVGARTKQLSPRDVKRLAKEIERMEYFELLDRYPDSPDACGSIVPDDVGVTTSVRASGRSKAISHYHGCRSGPRSRELDRLRSFEDLIDRVVETDPWVGRGRDVDIVFEEDRQRIEASRRQALEATKREEAERRSRNEVFELLQRAVRLSIDGKGNEAVEVYAAAADRGNCAAAYRLFEIYSDGFAGVQPDAAKAQTWSSSGKARGCPDPDLAQRLEGEGKGNEAVEVYIAAAGKGNCAAAKRLAEIYANGVAGVQPDVAKARMWSNYRKDVFCPGWRG